MVSNSVIDQFVKSLSFEVEAVPEKVKREKLKKQTYTPMNVKIRVRKKDEYNGKEGSIIVSKRNRHSLPARMRPTSSDQTILSFKVLIGPDSTKKSKKKSHKNFFGNCLGTQYDDDDMPYLPNIAYNGKVSDIVTSIKSETMLKHTLNLYKANNATKINSMPHHKNDSIFGKCKPGGCLDPPFGEDKYCYKLAIVDHDTPQDISTKTAKTLLAEHRTKNEASPTVQVIDKTEDDSIFSIYEAENFKSSIDTKYSDSIITYPPFEPCVKTKTSTGENKQTAYECGATFYNSTNYKNRSSHPTEQNNILNPLALTNNNLDTRNSQKIKNNNSFCYDSARTFYLVDSNIIQNTSSLEQSKVSKRSENEISKHLNNKKHFPVDISIEENEFIEIVKSRQLKCTSLDQFEKQIKENSKDSIDQLELINKSSQINKEGNFENLLKSNQPKQSQQFIENKGNYEISNHLIEPYSLTYTQQSNLVSQLNKADSAVNIKKHVLKNFQSSQVVSAITSLNQEETIATTTNINEDILPAVKISYQHPYNDENMNTRRSQTSMTFQNVQELQSQNVLDETYKLTSTDTGQQSKDIEISGLFYKNMEEFDTRLNNNSKQSTLKFSYLNDTDRINELLYAKEIIAGKIKKSSSRLELNTEHSPTHIADGSRGLYKKREGNEIISLSNEENNSTTDKNLHNDEYKIIKFSSSDPSNKLEKNIYFLNNYQKYKITTALHSMENIADEKNTNNKEIFKIENLQTYDKMKSQNYHQDSIEKKNYSLFQNEKQGSIKTASCNEITYIGDLFVDRSKTTAVQQEQSDELSTEKSNFSTSNQNIELTKRNKDEKTVNEIHLSTLKYNKVHSQSYNNKNQQIVKTFAPKNSGQTDKLNFQFYSSSIDKNQNEHKTEKKSVLSLNLEQVVLTENPKIEPSLNQYGDKLIRKSVESQLYHSNESKKTFYNNFISPQDTQQGKKRQNQQPDSNRNSSQSRNTIDILMNEHDDENNTGRIYQMEKSEKPYYKKVNTEELLNTRQHEEKLKHNRQIDFRQNSSKIINTNDKLINYHDYENDTDRIYHSNELKILFDNNLNSSQSTRLDGVIVDLNQQINSNRNSLLMKNTLQKLIEGHVNVNNTDKIYHNDESDNQVNNNLDTPEELLNTHHSGDRLMLSEQKISHQISSENRNTLHKLKNGHDNVNNTDRIYHNYDMVRSFDDNVYSSQELLNSQHRGEIVNIDKKPESNQNSSQKRNTIDKVMKEHNNENNTGRKENSLTYDSGNLSLLTRDNVIEYIESDKKYNAKFPYSAQQEHGMSYKVRKSISSLDQMTINKNKLLKVDKMNRTDTPSGTFILNELNSRSKVTSLIHSPKINTSIISNPIDTPKAILFKESINKPLLEEQQLASNNIEKKLTSFIDKPESSIQHFLSMNSDYFSFSNKDYKSQKEFNIVQNNNTSKAPLLTDQDNVQGEIIDTGNNTMHSIIDSQNSENGKGFQYLKSNNRFSETSQIIQNSNNAVSNEYEYLQDNIQENTLNNTIEKTNYSEHENNIVKTESTVEMNIGIQVIRNVKKQTIIKSFDTAQEPFRYPSNSVIIIRSQFQHDISIPIDSEYNMDIQIRKKISDRSTAKHANDDHKVSNSKTKIKSETVKCEIYSENIPEIVSSNNELQKTPSAIYGSNLIALFKSIKNLKKEIEILTNHQNLLKNLTAKHAKPKHLVKSCQYCNCWRK
ncbi:hypothetical protein ACJJTC_006808 [Scirpophaga incertulas]